MNGMETLPVPLAFVRCERTGRTVPQTAGAVGVGRGGDGGSMATPFSVGIRHLQLA